MGRAVVVRAFELQHDITGTIAFAQNKRCASLLPSFIPFTVRADARVDAAAI